MQRFAPDLDVFPQNFALAQDAASVVYLGNVGGVLSFDGERWQQISLPNQDLVRSLAFDGGSRVYVGGYDIFGYIERGPDGTDRFVDLTPQFQSLLKGERFADIWRILVTRQGVFFCAVRHLFLYHPDGGAPALWRHPGRFGAMVEHGGQIIVQFRGEGLRRLQDGQWLPMPGSQALSSLVTALLPLPDGGLLALGAEGPWREFTGSQVVDYPVPPGFPAPTAFNASVELADGSLALAGADGSLRLLDVHSGAQRRIRVADTPLTGILRAADGGLLALTDQALYHVDWPSPWTVIERADGYTGYTHRLVRWNGRWFALADNGVFAASPTPSAPPAPGAAPASSFTHLDWTAHEAWDLLPLDDRRALLAESYALEWIDGARVQAISAPRDLYPRLLLRSQLDPGLIYVGTEFGVALLQQQHGTWQLRIDRGDQASSVTGMVESASGELWYGSERDGVHRLRFAPDHSRVLEDRRLGAADGMVYGRLPAATVAVAADGAVLASTSQGLFRWDGQRFEPYGDEGLEALRQPGELLTLAAGADGAQWAYSAHRIYHRLRGAPWQAEIPGDALTGAIQTLAVDSSGALFGCTGSILRYDPAQAAAPGRPPQLLLRDAERIDADGRRQALELHSATQPAFTRGGFGLSFRFALPELRSDRGARYQARLIGHDDRYSEWGSATHYTYTHLPAGDYAFVARARDAFGQQTQTAPLRFSIVPPWYDSAWALALWSLLGVAALGGLTALAVVARTHRLRQAQLRLEREVWQRTQELEAANRRLEALAHLDGLTEIPNRRRLDSWLGQAWQRCADADRPMAVIIIDVDHFKTYNDREGHLAGDRLLKDVVQILSHCLRRSEDLVGRYGGDEFVAVLPGADLSFAQDVAARMHGMVRESGLGTISVGLAARRPRPHEPVTRLLMEADEALYRSKQRGRDCVSAFEDVQEA